MTTSGCERSLRAVRWLLGVLATLAATLFAHQVAQATDIQLAIEEPAGVTRTDEPVTAGVPLPAGSQTSTWSLWQAGSQIPVQITRLDGRAVWLLLDFQVDLGSNATTTLTLRDVSANVSTPDPVSTQETISQITVTTGPLQAVISKTQFNLFEEVSLDRNGNGAFEASERVLGSSGDNILIVDNTSGNTYSGTGNTDSITWEYQGPVRSTLRVDGSYKSGATELLDYTTRITFYAGRADVRVDHVLRNSFEPNQRHVKFRSATVRIGGGGQQLRAGRFSYGGNNSNSVLGPAMWANVSSSGVTYEIVPSQLYKGSSSSSSNNGMVLPDWTHHGASMVADFAEGLSNGQKADRENAVNSPLFARAEPGWYADHGEMTTSKFGGLDQEKAAYTAWGWSWTADQEPSDPHKPGYGFPPQDTHNDIEADDLWQNILMYLRTGSRGYLDRALHWARYFKWQYTYRTDGFDYRWNGNCEEPPVGRSQIGIPLTSLDQGYIRDLDDGKADKDWCVDHIFGWGLADYYHLTGDRDAIDALVDLAEISDRAYGHRAPGSTKISTNTRRYARNFNIVIRAYELTGAGRWRALMDHFRQLFMQAPDWDDRGFYYKTSSERPGQKMVFPLYVGAISLAWDRYYKITGDAGIRDRMVKYAQWARQYALHPVKNYSGSAIGMDWPNVGDVWHNYFDDPNGGFDPLYTTMFVDTLVRAYRLTGDQSFLDRAKLHWDRGSKGRRLAPDNPLAGPNEVGRFLNGVFRDANRYQGNGHMYYAHTLFYEAAGTPPGGGGDPPPPPANLRVK